MKGWVYIITNKAMPGLLKVGYSDRDPLNRARELDSTASPHNHIVDFAVLVDNPRRLEKDVHKKLSEFNEGKEWFNCDVNKAMSVITIAASLYTVTHGYNKYTNSAQSTSPAQKVSTYPKPPRQKKQAEIKKTFVRCSSCNYFFGTPLHLVKDGVQLTCGDCALKVAPNG